MVMCKTGVIGRVNSEPTCLSHSFLFAAVHLNFVNVSATLLTDN